MAETRHSYQLERNVEVIRNDVQLARQQIDGVYTKQLDLQERQDEALVELNKILNNTTKTLNSIAMSKSLNMAMAEVTRIEELLKKDFGHLIKIRRRTIGILQAVDIKIIKQNAIETTAQEGAIEAPGYWLSPALVSICYWIKNDQSNCEKSIKSTLSRNKTKGSLFFALVNKRFARFKATREWMIKYFTSQSIEALNRETIFVLNALANNSFGAEVRKECLEFFVERASEYLIKDEVNYENQVENWFGQLNGLPLPSIPVTDFERLRVYSTTWDSIERTLQETRSYYKKLDFFDDIFGGELYYNPKITAELDNLLRRLAKDPESDELQYISELERNRCIIKRAGDIDVANEDFEKTKALYAENFNCGEVFINATMHPEKFNSTKGTQRLATSLSKPHIIDAFTQLMQSYLSREVNEIRLKIGKWVGSTTNGENETDLVTDIENSINNERKLALQKVSVNIKFILISLGAIALLWFIGGGISWLLAIGGLVGGGLAFKDYNDIKNRKNKINTDYAEKLKNETALLKALIAEVVELREDVSYSKQKATSLLTLLENLDYHQYINSQYDKNKEKVDTTSYHNEQTVEETILNELTTIADGLPEWDLKPSEKNIIRRKESVV